VRSLLLVTPPVGRVSIRWDGYDTISVSIVVLTEPPDTPWISGIAWPRDVYDDMKVWGTSAVYTMATPRLRLANGMATMRAVSTGM
jgi:hypothetical protein